MCVTSSLQLVGKLEQDGGRFFDHLLSGHPLEEDRLADRESHREPTPKLKPDRKECHSGFSRQNSEAPFECSESLTGFALEVARPLESPPALGENDDVRPRAKNVFGGNETSRVAGEQRPVNWNEAWPHQEILPVGVVVASVGQGPRTAPERS